MTALGLDTSVAIPLLLRNHQAHAAVARWWDGREVALSGHALAETYSVLTRLPGDLRLAHADAARLLGERFVEPLLLGSEGAGRLPDVLSRHGIGGGAVYDALVAATARAYEATLTTADRRARATYSALDVSVTWLPARPRSHSPRLRGDVGPAR